MTCGFAPACAKRGVLETSHGFWLAKEKQGSKIDSAGALSFACVCGWAVGGPLSPEELRRPIKVETEFNPSAGVQNYTFNGVKVETDFKP